MRPDEAQRRASRLRPKPTRPSLVGWQVVTEPNSQFEENWVVMADIPETVVAEERLLYLQSLQSGEVITTTVDGLRNCSIHDSGYQLSIVVEPT